MDNLYELIGREQGLEKISRELTAVALDFHPSVVGAHHVTCSDETERECLDMFSNVFVKPLLPSLKLSSQAAFRTANLGGRYEWGSVHVAEHHFATRDSGSIPKLMVVKINAHVSRSDAVDGPIYGLLDRYAEMSECCGALHALMRGDDSPAIAEIREAFGWEGLDRQALLMDPEVVSERERGLVAAVLQARLQSMAAVADIMDRRPASPTVFLVVPCVTINIPALDDELLVGVFRVDWYEDEPRATYRGLGDDPRRYELSYEGSRVVVMDGGEDRLQELRPPRQQPLEAFLSTPEEQREPIEGLDKRFDDDLPLDFLALVEADPAEAAIRSFAVGLLPIHRLFQVDRLATDPTSASLASHLLGVVASKLRGEGDEVRKARALVSDIRRAMGV